MYNRIKNSLIDPKRLYQYAKDGFGKVVVYILILAALFGLVQVFELKYIPSEVKSILNNNVTITDVIGYKIENKELVPTDKLTLYGHTYMYYINVPNNNTGYKFLLAIGDKIRYNFVSNPTSTVVLHYDTDGVYFVIPLSDGNEDGMDLRYKLCDYPEEGFDLANVKIDGSVERNKLFNMVKHFIDDKMGLVYAIAIPAMLISGIIEIVMISLIMSLICFLVNKKFQLEFKVAFRLVLYSMFPLVLGHVFSSFFSGTVFGIIIYYVGFFATISYYLIAVKHYLVNKFTSYRKEDDTNESI